MEAATLRFSGRLQRHAPPRADVDDQLVDGVRSGDARAFEALFDRYHRPLLSFCRHMVGRLDEAEDALQQTFMSAYRGLVSSDRPIQLRAWLFTIARNHCLSILRTRRETAALDEAASTTDGLAAEVLRREDLRHMLSDVGRLPDDQRAALVLAEIGALSHQQIADVLGCRRAKVKALVFQARTSLTASREARETPCEDVRLQVANLSGGALRRSGLRRHIRECVGCREFEAEVRRQRRAMAVLLPVAPSLGLKSAVLGGVGMQTVGGAAVAGGVGGAASGGVGVLGGGGVTKLIAAGVLAVGAGGVALEGGDAQRSSKSRPAPRTAAARPVAVWATGHTARPKSAPTGAQAGEAGRERRRPAAVRTSEPRDSAADPGREGAGPGREAAGTGRQRTSLGAADTNPGLAGTSPGLAGTSPGRSQTSPGRSGNAPGRSGTPPGWSGEPPGHAGTAPGQAGTAPGRSGDDGAESSETPGDSPDQSGDTPGKSDKAPPGKGKDKDK